MKTPSFFARMSAAYKNTTEPEQLRILAEDSWNMLALLTVVLLILAVVFGLWEIFDVSATIEQAQNQTAENTPTTIDQAALDAASQALQDRTNAFDALTANPATSTIPDPSDSN